jgi:hypothetical protein
MIVLSFAVAGMGMVIFLISIVRIVADDVAAVLENISMGPQLNP